MTVTGEVEISIKLEFNSTKNLIFAASTIRGDQRRKDWPLPLVVEPMRGGQTPAGAWLPPAAERLLLRGSAAQ